jgi:hypothetical protein
MLSSLFQAPAARAAARPTFSPMFRPRIDELESRFAPAVMNLPIDVIGLDVGGTPEAPELNAVVSLAGQAIDVVPVNLSTEAIIPDPGEITALQEVSILHLELGPIELNLLGLEVETSEICLDITASPGEGLLGDLLGGLAGGLDLGGILDELGGQIDTVLRQLDRLLDRAVFDQLFTVTEVFGQPLGGGGSSDVAIHQEAVCDVLFLSLGPLDLSLLGLNVRLDDCDDGPVTIDVNANPEGGLLGQLLCGLAGGLDFEDINLNRLARRVDRLVDRLTDLADRVVDLPDLDELPRAVRRQINRLIDRLEDLAESADVLRDVDQVLAEVARVTNRLERILGRVL